MRTGIKTNQLGRQMGNKFGYTGSQFMGNRMEDRKAELARSGGSMHHGISNESNNGSQQQEPTGLYKQPKMHRPMILEKAKKAGKKGKDYFE